MNSDVTPPLPSPMPLARPGHRRVGDQVVEDDLIWLRDEAMSEDVSRYLSLEMNHYEQATAHLGPLRKQMVAESLDRLPLGQRTPSWNVAGQEHFFVSLPGHEFPQLVRRAADGRELVLLDGDSLTDTGFLRLGECQLSPDGRWLAYSVDVLGKEEYELRVRDTRTTIDIPYSVPHVYYGLEWLPDSSGLLYVLHDSAYRPHQVWLSHLGVGPDTLLLEETDPRFHLSLRVSGDGVHAIIRAASRLTSEEWLVPLRHLSGDASTTPYSVRGRTEGLDYTVEPCSDPEEAGDPSTVELLLLLNDTHEEFRLVHVMAQGSEAEPLVLLPGCTGQRPRTVTRRGSHIVVEGRKGGAPCLWLIPMSGDGTPLEVGPDEAGGTVQLQPYDTRRGASVCVATESRRTPRAWFAVDLDDGTRHEIHRVSVGHHEPSDYRTDVLDITARDGTAIPVTVLRREGIDLDGTAPCLLYGYGAWEHVIQPQFDPLLMSLLDRGVVFAHAHVRGGGERGHGWWQQGRMASKQRTFDDFLDVADQLAGPLVDPTRIVARGLSAGGLLMGAAYSQRPDRWAGVIAEAPFVDPLTTMSDESAPLVVTERDEWGDPRRTQDREWMTAWSPYDNVPPTATRPPLLVTSAVNDPRVSVWEPARWVARLRLTGSTSARLLFRCDLGARGHWPAPGVTARREFEAELMAWALEQLGFDTRRPRSGIV